LQIGNSTNLKINLLVFNNNDQCGSSSKSNGENKSQFSFSVKIFKYMDMKKFNENRFDEKNLLPKTDNNVNMKHFCLENMGLNLIKSQEYEKPNQIIFSKINDFRFLINITSNPSIYNTELTNIFLNPIAVFFFI
jgi:hypothetical protein